MTCSLRTGGGEGIWWRLVGRWVCGGGGEVLGAGLMLVLIKSSFIISLSGVQL